MSQSNPKYQESSVPHSPSVDINTSGIFGSPKGPSTNYSSASTGYSESESSYAGSSYTGSPVTQHQSRSQKRSVAQRSDINRNRVTEMGPQFVSILADDSGSMRFDGKCEALTEGAREMIYEMQLRSRDGVSAFTVAMLKFGDEVIGDERTLCVPVLDIVPDEIKFTGSSGQTKIKKALQIQERLLEFYDLYVVRCGGKDVPPPLCCLFSDGFNGDGNPIPVAERIKRKRLANGTYPMIVTCGIEFGDDEPDVALLQRLATVEVTSGRPLYFDISDLDMLIKFLAFALSSGSVSPSQFLQIARTVNPDW